ncbi:hypothetical protein HPB52_011461 [Rhipicephalus sanguineus]|uniref:Nlr family card domain protein n=1 Tax=Rhipicephalus sanguineus TaxID=34632 RepID=A0A9D4PYC9_RHISA|nr:hypothetical protein HPB52_011461 [Rhipicephalus sanguineus]
MADAQPATCAAYAGCGSGDAGAFPRHLQMPCTKVGDSDCQLLLYLRSTRELLLGASLELVEDQRRPGGLRLAVVQAPTSPCPLPCSLDRRREEMALHYAEHLLSEHRCITAVEINGSTTQPQSLLDALARNLAVKSVTVRLALDRIVEANVRVLEVVNELSHLEELEFAPISCNMQSRCEDATYLKGPLMERRTEHLRSLDVSVLRLSSESVRRLVWALIWNRTITELAVPECVFRAYFHDNDELFGRYLKKKDATLRKLTLKALGVFKDPENALVDLARGFCAMTTLEELNMDMCLDEVGFAGRIEPFARVVAQNTTLRSLGLPSAVCRRCRSATPGFFNFHHQAREIQPWLTALRKTSSLQKLKIDFRIFGQAAFEAFLKEVAKSDNLRSVVLTHPPTRMHPLDICRLIREHGLCNRVRIADHHVESWSLPSITQCVDVTRVTVDASHFTVDRLPPMRMSSAMMSVFGLCEHGTLLRVNCDLFIEPYFSVLCAYLSVPSALADIELTLRTRTLYMTAAESRSVPSRLSSALASNTNLCSVIIKGLQLSNDDLDVLADAARKSRRLTEFRYVPHYRSALECICRERLYAEEPPFRLDSHAYAALVEIQNSTRRNAGRVSAAARFVLGERDTAEAALGIELLHDHPHLLELVRDGALVDTEEAKVMIGNARKKLRKYRLHKFMRCAGVVFQSVECHPQHDGRLQLSDINEDCWSLICSYLSLADIAETAGSPGPYT